MVPDAGRGLWLPWTSACLEERREPEPSEASWRLGQGILLNGPFVTLTCQSCLDTENGEVEEQKA